MMRLPNSTVLVVLAITWAVTGLGVVATEPGGTTSVTW
jgi:hypothetical protein